MKSFLLVVALGLASAKLHPLSDEFINIINSKQSSWKAGRNFAEDTPLEQLKGLCGVLEGNGGVEIPRRMGMIPKGFVVPESFDAREEWPHCPTVSEIRDQGSCGSCWAVGAVSVMSDRACIHSNGTANFRYSTEDMISCCGSCGFGCDGGWLEPSFSFWQKTGVVSGGRYNSKEGCRPYTIAECEHHIEGERPPCGDIEPTPSCTEVCIEEYGLGYPEDKQHGAEVYSFYLQEEEMQYDIMTNGPVEAAFSVYEDFLTYKSGVYRHIEGASLGGHAIRIIGWGVENNDPYWLVANSWNYDWGDKGLFKILRGSNECGIEDNVVAGTPA
ncbi:cathepsin B-like [Macrobrachium rosenbergii]|uniref:Cathepsin B n=2 Tax=cellular organisms TaxID=131567 RepID=A0A2I5R2M7_MACRS|nr:Cathepsin B [Macrobrachium rosenbergii]